MCTDYLESAELFYKMYCSYLYPCTVQGFGQEHGCFFYNVLLYYSFYPFLFCVHTQWDVFQLYCSLDTQLNGFVVKPSEFVSVKCML